MITKKKKIFYPPTSVQLWWKKKTCPFLWWKEEEKMLTSSYQRTALVEGKGKKKKAVDKCSCNSYNPTKDTTNGYTGSLKTQQLLRRKVFTL